MPIEFIGETPHVGIVPSAGRENERSDPYVGELIRVGVWNSRVASVHIRKEFVHSSVSLCSALKVPLLDLNREATCYSLFGFFSAKVSVSWLILPENLGGFFN